MKILVITKSGHHPYSVTGLNIKNSYCKLYDSVKEVLEDKSISNKIVSVSVVKELIELDSNTIIPILKSRNGSPGGYYDLVHSLVHVINYKDNLFVHIVSSEIASKLEGIKVSFHNSPQIPRYYELRRFPIIKQLVVFHFQYPEVINIVIDSLLELGLLSQKEVDISKLCIEQINLFSEINNATS